MDDSKIRNDQLPVYNIKAVSRLLGLLPVTLRAWERRYGLPNPQRGEQGYRLYSEQDLRTLRWLKSQIDSGLSIGRAALYLNELRQAGQDPALTIMSRPQGDSRDMSLTSSPSLMGLSDDLLDRLLHFDESGSSEALRRAFALYSVDQVLLDMIIPALVEIGDRWHKGNLPIASEHYATQFIMQHLMSMLAASAPPTRPGLIVAACAPGESHQIGLLMLVVMLRWRGWNVKYLGPDLLLDRLEEALGPIHPSILMFTANRPETAAGLAELPAVLGRFPNPKPLVVVGGQAFLSYRLPDSVPVMYIQGTPSDTVTAIENLMTEQIHPARSLRG
jgi:DNA-binding transcriptional MerR regulator